MKIFFINPPFKAEYGKFSRESRSPCIGHSGVLYYPLWLIYAAAYSKKCGYEVEFLDAPAKLLNKEKSLEIIREKGKDVSLFVFNTSTPSIYSDCEFCEAVKNMYPDSFTVLVGTHPSATVNETFTFSEAIDGIARKEYDFIIKNLADAINNNEDLSVVKGLSYRKNGEIIDNPDAEHIENLDEIPFASEFIKEYLDVNDYVFPASALPEIQIFTGRGCPARCNYCVYPQTLHGHKYRLRSVDNVIAEFEYILKNFPEVKQVVIEDDTFTVNKKRTVEFCEKMISSGMNKKIRWLCNARVNLDLETMKIMKKAGCKLIIPGIESVDQTILNNIRKGITVEQIENYIKNAKKAGLMIHACYMVGNKGETKETMQRTLDAALRFKTDTMQFFPLIPYPGTEAYNWAKENGYIKQGYSHYLKEDGTLNCVISTEELSSDELVAFCAHARKKYYLRPWYICHRIKRGLTDFEDLKRSLKAFLRLKNSLFKKDEYNG